MVYTLTSSEVAPGLDKEAQDWLKRFYAHIKQAYGIQAEWMRALDPAPGQANRILAITPYDSLSAWAAHMEKVAKDPKRNALVSEAYQEKLYFVTGSLT